MFQTFSADRADYALHISTLPRRPSGAEHLCPHLDLFSELLSVNPVSISQKISRCAVKGKGFDNLLSSPLCSGMSRDSEMDHPSAFMGQHHPDEQNLKPNGVHREEVDRNEL